MILLSNDPREPAARQRLVDLLGAEDARVVAQWVLETHRRFGASYGEALEHVTQECATKGRGFSSNLLEIAKKPKHLREAEMEITAWVVPKISTAVTTIRGHRGNPEVADRLYKELVAELDSTLARWYPSVHEATRRGALLTSCSHAEGQISINVAALVRALDLPDPMRAFTGVG